MPGRLDLRGQSGSCAIDVFVGGLDLAELGFDGVDPEATGRPSYYPSVLLKLYIYGYLNRVQSSRRLEREAGRNVEVMWLTRRLITLSISMSWPIMATSTAPRF
jgi:transposase